jgi:site-specific recombinase XerD
MQDPASLPALLQSFFTTRLMTQRKVSPHTIASYRDTFRLLLQFAQKQLRKAPSQLALHDLDASLVGAFLEDLENRRRNGAKSRNLRLTAIRSFFRYATLESTDPLLTTTPASYSAHLFFIHSPTSSPNSFLDQMVSSDAYLRSRFNVQ